MTIRQFTLFSSAGDPSLPSEDHVPGKKERGLFVVADGFGGAVAGQRAARTACESVFSFLDKEAGDRDATLPFVLRSYFSLAGNVLFNALVFANQKVGATNKGKSANEKGGASVLAAFLDEDIFALANVGACSAWLVRGGRIQELVSPRTYARLLDPTLSDPDPDHAIPLMAMGISEDLEPEIIEFRVQPGDWVILQTDGVRAEIRERIARLQADLPAESESLEDFLKARTYSDHATLALIRF